MKKNNARSLKIPSASWIRNVIKEEVKAQLEEREAQKRAPRHDFWDGPRGEFAEGPRTEGPRDERDSWDEWWDGPRQSRSESEEREGREGRPEPRRRRATEEDRAENSERRVWNFWDGDYMSDPILEPPRRARREDLESASERDIEASISPVEKPRAKRTRTATPTRSKRR